MLSYTASVSTWAVRSEMHVPPSLPTESSSKPKPHSASRNRVDDRRWGCRRVDKINILTFPGKLREAGPVGDGWEWWVPMVLC
jgi:hypothetical protein